MRREANRYVKYFLKALFITLGIIATLFMICFGIVLGPRFCYMKSEYVTAGVIRDTDRFVTEHPHQWPKSWRDLGVEDFSQYTDFRFDLTPEMIARDPELIYSAIQPQCHQYRTYPHAKTQLKALSDKLLNEQPKESTDSLD